MARFYFHLASGEEYERDEIGSEHSSADDAYLEAYETAQQMVVDLIRERRNPGQRRFDICDEEGRLVFQVPFTEIFGPRIEPQAATAIANRGVNLAAAEVRNEIVTARAELDSLRAVLKKL